MALIIEQLKGEQYFEPLPASVINLLHAILCYFLAKSRYWVLLTMHMEPISAEGHQRVWLAGWWQYNHCL